LPDRTLYDVLEVSKSASQDMIDAAFTRLSAKFTAVDESKAVNPTQRFYLDAVNRAYATLSDPEKRTQYDRKLELDAFTSVRRAPVAESVWTLPKLALIGIVVLGVSGFYYKHQKEQTRLEAEKVIANAKAREAEAQARETMEKERLTLQRERELAREAKNAEARQRSNRDADVQRYRQEAQSVEGRERSLAQREEYAKQTEAARLKREEQMATVAAQQRLARDRAELCRMEMARYGRSMSC
jgi:curved DNA-binding protein CbpA